MKNELNDAWDERVAADNAAIKEIADRFYDGDTEFPPEERVKLSLRERAKIHGCHTAASWEYDYSALYEELTKHTGLSLQEALLFQIHLELKRRAQ